MSSPPPRTVGFEKYYSCVSHLLAVHEMQGRRLALRASSRTEFARWQEETRAALRAALGFPRYRRCDLQPVRLEREELPGCAREKWLIQTESGVWMPFYLLIPPQAAHQPVPAVLALHGHGGAGKLAVAGRNDIPAVQAANEKYHYDYGPAFCAQGYLVLCPDARGFGERREFYFGQPKDEAVLDEKFFLESSCEILARKALALGQTLPGMWTWDLMRLIDYVETRLDFSPGQVACAGLSGGGLQTLWLSAMDERVGAAIVSGNFFGFRDSLLQITRCACSYIPQLCELVDVGDIGALIAPRPLLIESATEDELAGPRGLKNVIEQVEITRQAYEICEAGQAMRHFVFKGAHTWNGEAAGPFLRRAFSP